MSDWVILRTAGRHTLRLAETLGRDGFECWTPQETRSVRVPRKNARREVVLPIMPSYIFARATHLIDLLTLAALKPKPRRGAGLLDPAHADFSVMHWNDRIPVIADYHLAELRKIEAKRTPRKRAAYSFPRNASARVNGGAFCGLTGIVVRSTPMKTVLRFSGSFPVELPTSLLDIGDRAFEMAA